MKTIIIIWASLMILIIYLIYRYNWTNSSLKRIYTIVLRYASDLGNQIDECFKNGNEKIATEMIDYINSLGGKDFVNFVFRKIAIGDKKLTKNIFRAYFIRSLRKPFTFSTTRIIHNKLIWSELNNLMYGKGNWE